MNCPFINTDFSRAELALMANLMAFGSVQLKNTGDKTPPPKTAQPSRVEVVYIGGCFKEAQNIKRWLDVTTGILYDAPECNRAANRGFVAAGAHLARPVYVNSCGDKVRFMQHITPGGTLHSCNGVTAQGGCYKQHMDGSFPGYNGYTVINVQQPAQATKVNVTYLVGTTEFNIEYAATHHAKHMAILHPGKEFTVDKVTKVVTKSKPYKVTETAQVKTVKTKSWE